MELGKDAFSHSIPQEMMSDALEEHDGKGSIGGRIINQSAVDQ